MNSKDAQMISAAQSRAARAWLNITQQDLADRSLVHKKTIADFERGASVPHDRTLRDLSRALEELGIEFLFDGARARGVADRRLSD